MRHEKNFQLGLIGWKLGHSLSPAMHNAALKALEMDGEYHLYSIAPLPEGSADLKSLLEKVRCGEIDGLNVTIPHKQNIIPLLDELTPTARKIGAANTIIRNDKKLIGDNTDSKGFMCDLDNFLAAQDIQFDEEVKEVLILGAGGAARAAVFALVQSGWNIIIAARRAGRAKEMAASFESGNVRSTVLDSQGISALSPQLIVNATPVGMFPDVDTSPWPDDLPLPKNTAIYDLVYNPPKTRLIHDAHKANVPATTGLGMLVEQGAIAFHSWTGKQPPREIMWTACKQALETHIQ